MNEIDKHIGRLKDLKSLRSKHESKWIECYQFGAPEIEPSFNGNTEQKDRAKIYDSTAIDGVQLLASSLVSGTVPANSKWFNAVLNGIQDSQETEGERWLDQVTDMMYSIIYNSNFSSEVFDLMMNYVVAGWGVLYTSIDDDEYVFENWDISGCYISSTKKDGTIDVIFREFEMSPAQLADEYGVDSLHPKVSRQYEQHEECRVKVLHIIEPRSGTHGDLATNMPYRSFHIDLENKHSMRDSGYKTFPCSVPRATLIPNSHYAVGQMYKALPDAKTLNIIKPQLLNSFDLNLNGFWAVRDDGIMNVNTIQVGAGEMVVVNDIDNSIRQINTNVNLNLADWQVRDIQEQIRRVLMSNQLQAQDGPQMTATEVHVRVDLIRQMLGPVFGRLQSEFLNRLLERTYSLGMDSGWFGEPPEDLQGGYMNFRFENPLARSQRLEEVSAIDRFSMTVSNLAQVEPSILDNINFDAAASTIANGLGVPAGVLRTSDEVTAFREQKQQARKQAEQQQAEQQQQSQMADMAGQMALKQQEQQQ